MIILHIKNLEYLVFLLQTGNCIMWWWNRWYAIL